MERLRWVAVGAIALIGLAAIAWQLNLLDIRGSSLGSVASAFDQPPDDPGYTWTRDGHAVSREELTTIAGPEHCGWQSATFLVIGWPPGTYASSATMAREYVRDPRGVVDESLRARLVLHATLPPDARATGYRYGSIEVYVSPTESDEAIFVVGPSGAERWPRSDPMMFCV